MKNSEKYEDVHAVMSLIAGHLPISCAIVRGAYLNLITRPNMHRVERNSVDAISSNSTLPEPSLNFHADCRYYNTTYEYIFTCRNAA